MDIGCCRLEDVEYELYKAPFFIIFIIIRIFLSHLEIIKKK